MSLILKINEIFNSLQGEIDGFGEQGCATTFIRLEGCNLIHPCTYCDTLNAFKDEDTQNAETTEISVGEVLAKVNLPKVTITGGEPLLQYQAVVALTQELIFRGIRTTIETNGTVHVPGNFINISGILSNKEYRRCYLRIVMDYKLPSSGVEQLMDLYHLKQLQREDVVKFVVADIDDYTRMREILTTTVFAAKAVLSPVIKMNAGRPPDLTFAHRLAVMLLNDETLKRRVQLGIQLHKFLGVL